MYLREGDYAGCTAGVSWVWGCRGGVGGSRNAKQAIDGASQDRPTGGREHRRLRRPPRPTSRLVERCLAARKEYENSLKALYEHYAKAGDKIRLQWAEKELMGYHIMWKPSYNLDVKDVPPPTLEGRVNVKEANDLYRTAMEYKGKGFGDEYILNMRRAELLFREVLEKYPNSDKIGDVAYQLGDLYESRAYKQHDRAAKYYERSTQWVKGSRTDARLRARPLSTTAS